MQLILNLFSVTWSFRNHSYMLVWCSRNSSFYYQCWKQLCSWIFLWTLLHIVFQHSLIKIKFKRTAFIQSINLL